MITFCNHRRHKFATNQPVVIAIAHVAFSTVFSGSPTSVSALAAMYSRLLSSQVDAKTEVTVALGAMQALFQTCTGLFRPGDEVSWDVQMGTDRNSYKDRVSNFQWG